MRIGLVLGADGGAHTVGDLVTAARKTRWQELPEALGPLAQYAAPECLEAIATPGVALQDFFTVQGSVALGRSLEIGAPILDAAHGYALVPMSRRFAAPDGGHGGAVVAIVASDVLSEALRPGARYKIVLSFCTRVAPSNGFCKKPCAPFASRSRACRSSA